MKRFASLAGDGIACRPPVRQSIGGTDPVSARAVGTRPLDMFEKKMAQREDGGDGRTS